jgi:hypothetical protein
VSDCEDIVILPIGKEIPNFLLLKKMLQRCVYNTGPNSFIALAIELPEPILELFQYLSRYS